MEWPAKSPDCNPIENVWALLKARIRQRNIATLKGIIRALKQERSSLTAEYATNLAESCTRRCQAVIDQRGAWIPY